MSYFVVIRDKIYARCSSLQCDTALGGEVTVHYDAWIPTELNGLNTAFKRLNFQLIVNCIVLR